MKIEDIIREVRANGISSSLIPDSDLQLLIARAFRVYNRYRPRYLHSTFTTVARQGEYSVDDNAAAVIDVFWEPSATGDVIARLLAEMEAQSIDFNYPSLLAIFQINRSRLRNATRGRWRAYGRQVRLIPVPDSDGIIVPYIYSSPWDDIDDIPIGEEDVLIDGIMATANMALARARAGVGGWRAGDYQVEGGSSSSEMQRSASEYNDWLSRLAGGGLGIKG